MAAIDTGLAGLWQAMRERREQKRTLAQLSRYEPRLLRDIGLDPEAIARSNAWDFEVVHGPAVGSRP